MPPTINDTARMPESPSPSIHRECSNLNRSVSMVENAIATPNVWCFRHARVGPIGPNFRRSRITAWKKASPNRSFLNLGHDFEHSQAAFLELPWLLAILRTRLGWLGRAAFKDILHHGAHNSYVSTDVIAIHIGPRQCLGRYDPSWLANLLQVNSSSHAAIAEEGLPNQLGPTPFGGSFVILMPLCKTGTGNLGDGMLVSHSLRQNPEPSRAAHDEKN